MKNRLISIVVTAAVIIAVAAGSAPAQHKWYGGLKIGFNSSQFRGDPVSPWVFNPSGSYYITGAVADKLPGLIVGGFFRRDIGTWFALQLDLMYSMKGGQGPVNGIFRIVQPSNVEFDGVVNGDLKVRMDYIEFPLLAVFRFPKDTESNVGFTVELGPCIGYNTRAEAQLTGTAEVSLSDGSKRVQNYDERIPIQGDINRWAVSGVVGAALEFYLAKQTFILEGRYQFDVTSISSDQNTYNHVFSLMIGFMAPIIN